MRSIKFRAWNRKKGVMEQVTRIKGEIMQYTGIKDYRGHEIYEGDILATIPLGSVKPEYRERILGEVYWNEYERGCHNNDVKFGWVVREKNHCVGVSIGVWMHVMDGSKSEVVGNLYENPELMK